MHNEGVLCIKPSLRITIAFTQDLVVVSGFTYVCLREIKNYFLRTNKGVDIGFNIQDVSALCYAGFMSVF